MSLIRGISDWNDLINDLVLTTIALIVLYKIRQSPLTRDNKFLVGIPGLIALAGIAYIPYDTLIVAGREQNVLSDILAVIGNSSFYTAQWLFPVEILKSAMSLSVHLQETEGLDAW